nr:MAG: hypothetical protein [Molluscum contagiosum virus]
MARVRVSVTSVLVMEQENYKTEFLYGKLATPVCSHHAALPSPGRIFSGEREQGLHAGPVWSSTNPGRGPRRAHPGTRGRSLL